MFGDRGRSPFASINFLTAHDGFTLADSVAYNERHNHANGEDNRDGHSANFSYNHGAEGATDDADINQLRLQQRKNLLASLLLAQGTPMLLAGDEVGNSQNGNNNAYCQDNAIGWIDWDANQLNGEIHEFIKLLIRLRRNHPLINRPTLPHGLTVSDKTGLADISWLRHDGHLMTADDWAEYDLNCFAMMLASTDDLHKIAGSEKICSLDDAIIFIFNRSAEEQQFQLPATDGSWAIDINTAISVTTKTATINNDRLPVSAHSFVMCSYLHNTKNRVANFQ